MSLPNQHFAPTWSPSLHRRGCVSWGSAGRESCRSGSPDTTWAGCTVGTIRREPETEHPSVLSTHSTKINSRDVPGSTQGPTSQVGFPSCAAALTPARSWRGFSGRHRARHAEMLGLPVPPQGNTWLLRDHSRTPPPPAGTHRLLGLRGETALGLPSLPRDSPRLGSKDPLA